MPKPTVGYGGGVAPMGQAHHRQAPAPHGVQAQWCVGGSKMCVHILGDVGFRRNRKGTLGGSPRHGSQSVTRMSSTHVAIVFSSRNAASYAVVGVMVVGMQHVYTDVGIAHKVNLSLAACATFGIARRPEVGPDRHVEVKP